MSQHDTYGRNAFSLICFSIAGIAILTAASFHVQGQTDASMNTHTAHTYTPQKLKEMGAALAVKASTSPDGAASETLEEFSGHKTMLAYRHQSGGAEVHDHFADVFMIVEGSAMLETGGTVVAPTTTSPGETRGTALEHSTAQAVHAGDVVQIPPRLPHRMKLEPGGKILYFVVKLQEIPAQ